MGNNVVKRLRSKHVRPPRTQDEPTPNKPTASPNVTDHNAGNVPNRVRNPAGTSSNPPPAAPTPRGIDPESSNTPQVTLNRGIDAPTAVSLSRGIDPQPTVSLSRGIDSQPATSIRGS